MWENERCQFKLPLGGLLPPALRIEVRMAHISSTLTTNTG